MFKSDVCSGFLDGKLFTPVKAAAAAAARGVMPSTRAVRVSAAAASAAISAAVAAFMASWRKQQTRPYANISTALGKTTRCVTSSEQKLSHLAPVHASSVLLQLQLVPSPLVLLPPAAPLPPWLLPPRLPLLKHCYPQRSSTRVMR